MKGLLNQPTDVYICFLTWAIMLFLLTLDALICSIREDRKKRNRKGGGRWRY